MALSGSANFLSASEYGSFGNSNGTARALAPECNGETPSYASGPDFIPTDFVGLNINVLDGLTGSDNQLGHRSGDRTVPILNEHDPTSNCAGQGKNWTPVYSNDAKGPDLRYASPTLFNTLMLNRNGPYQHPSWKQIRGGEHPVARALRLNNTMSIDVNDPDAVKREENRSLIRHKLDGYTHKETNEYYDNINKKLYLVGQLTDIDLQAGVTGSGDAPKLQQFYEPSVVSKYKPFIYDVDSSGGPMAYQTFRVRSSLMNQMVYFENDLMNFHLKIAATTPISGAQNEEGVRDTTKKYYKLLHVAKNRGARTFIYSQTIFPKSVNTYRRFKLEKLHHDETGTLSDSPVYDKTINRSFWRENQAPLTRSIIADGTTYRIRNDNAALNSQDEKQQIWLHDVVIDHTKYGLGLDTSTTGNGLFVNPGLNLFFFDENNYDAAVSAINEPAWHNSLYLVETGVVVGYGENVLSGGTHPGSGLPTNAPYFSYQQNESFNPYPVALLSMWPLDPRPDIYDKPAYLTSPIGGQGLQIGVTPHRCLEWNTDVNVPGSGGAGGQYPTGAVLDTYLRDTDSIVFSGNFGYLTHQFSLNFWYHSATASYYQLKHIKTGSAGELVYSTKPTMFYHKALTQAPGLEDEDETPESGRIASYSRLHQQQGYMHQTASMQYNRHAFPYNTPFYATNRVRGRDPYFASYSQHFDDIKYIARDHSIIPEYRIADNIEYYLSNYFNAGTNLNTPLYKQIDIRDTPNHEKKTKILRNASLATRDDLFKINFLRIEGIDGNLPETSSAGRYENMDGFGESDFGYLYDNLTQDTVRTEFIKKQRSYNLFPPAVRFSERFTHTDDLVEFSNLIDQPFDDGINTIPSRIKFKISTANKILPGKNFYPVTKTVEMGTHFKRFVYDILDDTLPLTGSEVGDDGRVTAQTNRKQGMLQSLLEPFFAPGILYNSIKSGLAVDYPVYLNQRPVYFAPLPYFSGAVPQQKGQKITFRDGRPDIEYYAGATPQDWLLFLYPGGYKDRFNHTITSSFNYGGFQMLGGSRAIPAILNNCPTQRMPFEALYDTSYLDPLGGKQFLYLTTDFLDLDLNTPTPAATASSNGINSNLSAVHPGAAYTPTGPRALLTDKPSTLDTNVNKQLYELSINNYLCETMNFFLVDQDETPGLKFPVIASSPRQQNDFSYVDPDNTYYMEVSLRMGRDQVNCEGPRNAGMGGGLVKPQNTFDADGNVMTENIFANHQRNHSMRGYIYGPPIECAPMYGNATTSSFPLIYETEVIDRSRAAVRRNRKEPHIKSWRMVETPSATGSGLADGEHFQTRYAGGEDADFESYFAANLQDPAYAAFTPPYFYGESSLIIAFTPDENVTYDVQKIWAKCRQPGESYYFEDYVTGSSANWQSSGSSTTDTLCKYLPATSSAMMVTNARMKIEASIDIFGDLYPQLAPVTEKLQDNTDGTSLTYTSHIWYMAPKWVCPVLDFSGSKTTTVSYARSSQRLTRGTPQNVEVSNSFHDGTTGKGLWGGYGTDPYDSSLRSSNESTDRPTHGDYDKGVYLSVKFPYSLEGEERSDTSYTIGYNLHHQTGQYTNRGGIKDFKTTGSLLDKLGFQERSYPIGQIANSKTVSEALIIIPYLEKPIDIRAGGFSKDLISGDGYTKATVHYNVPGNDMYSTRELMPGKHFLPIQKTLFENILSMNLALRDHDLSVLLKEENNFVGFNNMEEYEDAKSTDVYKMIDVLLGDASENRPGYEIPVELDFVNFAIDPFQMFVVPIEETFSKQDLIDIYQGIMPENSLRYTKSKSTFTANPVRPALADASWMPVMKDDDSVTPMSVISPQNFLNPQAIIEFNKGNLGGWMEKTTSVCWLESAKHFYKNIKFMTFKVKQRSIKDYKRYRRSQIARVVQTRAFENMADPSKRTFNPSTVTGDDKRRVRDIFGYNWPYDDFSIFEVAKIDLEMEIEG